jgi:hypothetical protein
VPIPLADNFFAGSLISLLFPTLLLIALVTWYLIAVKHVGRGDKKEPQPAAAGEQSTGSSATTPSGQLAAATAGAAAGGSGAAPAGAEHAPLRPAPPSGGQPEPDDHSTENEDAGAAGG